MANKNYVKGRNFEYRVKSDLEKMGYEVMRSYASKGPFDLFAAKLSDILYVQCKTGSAKIKWEEWNTLLERAKIHSGRAVLAENKDGHIEYLEILQPITDNLSRSKEHACTRLRF